MSRMRFKRLEIIKDFLYEMKLNRRRNKLERKLNRAKKELSKKQYRTVKYNIYYSHEYDYSNYEFVFECSGRYSYVEEKVIKETLRGEFGRVIRKAKDGHVVYTKGRGKLTIRKLGD